MSLWVVCGNHRETPVGRRIYLSEVGGRSCGQSSSRLRRHASSATVLSRIKAGWAPDSRAAGSSSCRKTAAAGKQQEDVSWVDGHLPLFERHCPHSPQAASWQREACAMLTHAVCVCCCCLLFHAGTPAARASSTSWVWRQCWAAPATQLTQVGILQGV